MDAIDGWVEDHGNFDTMGHRRWVLYPPMKSTGFGFSGHYTSMYCFDNTFQNTKYNIISLLIFPNKIPIINNKS